MEPDYAEVLNLVLGALTLALILNTSLTLEEALTARRTTAKPAVGGDSPQK
jgi:hypothetical protein